MKQEFDYEQDLNIDPDALDVEWLGQANTFMKYSREAANMKMEVGKAKELVDVTRAALEFAIRDDPEAFKDLPEKKTESVINSAIALAGQGKLEAIGAKANYVDPLMKDYQEALHALNEAQRDYDYVQAAVRSMDHKRTALENLVKLAQQNYFATPDEPRDLSKEAQKRATREGAASKMRNNSSSSRSK